MQAEDVPAVPADTTEAPAEAVKAAPERPLNVSPVRIVEAALFSSGKPLAVDEIAENTGLGKRQVTSALKKLVKEYQERDTALEISESGKGKWAMQVQTVYTEATYRLAPKEIPVRVLKTLALIAYHQPILQSDLIDLVGAKGYDHVRELYERGLVKRRVHDRSFMLLTSDRFPEYFGIPASDREEIKRFLADKLGIVVPDKDKSGNKRLTSYRDGDTRKEAPAPQEAPSDAGAPDAPADASAPDAPADAPAPEPAPTAAPVDEPTSTDGPASTDADEDDARDGA